VTAPHPPGRDVELVAVVIPVRDEETRIGRCLDALGRAIAELSVEPRPHRPRPRVRAVAVLDRCRDRTADVVADYPWVDVVPSAAGRVGAARALGVNAVLATERIAAERIWVASTDADSRVPPDWLTHQLDAAARGADLFRGLVEPDPDECGLETYRLWATGYERRDGHPHIHGANLGMRADAYVLCGGFDELAALDEDVTLAHSATLRALRVVASAGAVVTTSGRLRGRVDEGGFAAHLSQLSAG